MSRVTLFIVLVLCLASCRQRSGANNTGSSGSASRAMPGGTVTPSGPLLSYADVVDRVAPAVVTIRSSRRVRQPQQFPFFDDPFFREFFGGGVPRGGNRTQIQQALGSGVIVNADGHIVTNFHVVDGAEDIKVESSDRHTFAAKIVGTDSPSDLAVLKINAGNMPLLPLGDSDQVRVGDVCLAVGNPLGVGETVTSGIISAKGRATGLSNGSFQDFLQTDAPINQGNSGGALVNTRGELIGINSQILSNNGGNIGIGFAIPSNMAKTVMNQLVSKGKVQRGMLGVGIQPVTGDLAESLGLKETRGVAVNSVTPGGPADKAGLKPGDVILQLNGKNVTDANVLRNEIAESAPGTEIALTISRNGNQQTLKAKLGELTPQSAAAEASRNGEGGGGSRLGITAQRITPEIAQQLGVRPGTRGLVIVQIDPDGPGAQVGLQAGDIIQEVNRVTVNSPEDMQNALAKSGDRPPLLWINRGGQMIYIPVPMR